VPPDDAGPSGSGELLILNAHATADRSPVRPAGVGKFTVGRALAAETGFRLLHDHAVVDLVETLFAFGNPGFIGLRERLWLETVDSALAANLPGLILTFAPERSVPQSFLDEVRAHTVSPGGMGRRRAGQQGNPLGAHDPGAAPRAGRLRGVRDPDARPAVGVSAVRAPFHTAREIWAITRCAAFSSSKPRVRTTST